jgi:hypothetical protein
MRLSGAPRLRRQGARRRAAVRQSIDMVGRAVDRRAWSLTPAQYARFLDLYFRDDETPGLDPAERDEFAQLWAWCTADVGKPALEAWLRVPGPVSTRPRPPSPPAG